MTTSKERPQNISSEDKSVIEHSVMSEKDSAGRPSYFVGIGASAGGLEALQTFFSNMPPDSGLAFIIIQHLSPDYKSLMVELLSKNTQMDVMRVVDGVRIKPNCIYLIPPKKNMVVHGGNLYLSEQPQRHTLNLPIDVFLHSLAEDQAQKAIGIILSGTGSDGTRGVRAIKEEGGTVIVQSAESAKFDSMPNSAIATGLADFVLPPEEMPGKLLQFISHPFMAQHKEPADAYTEEDKFTSLFGLLKKQFNVDFTHYKPTTVIRRVERRMGIKQVHSLDAYLSLLRADAQEVGALYKDLLIGVTKFFRDAEQFKLLREEVVPKLFANAAKRDNPMLRVWVAGCSTGEEAYSLAMLLREYQDAHGDKTEVKVFATDIDQKAIEAAAMGLYPESIVADVEMSHLSKYFDKRSSGYQVKRFIREMVVFALQNIIKDPPFTKMDLISCRNLLIYLQPVLQKKVLAIFNYALLPDGYLFLGSSETIGDMAEVFRPLDPKIRVFRHLGQGTLPLKGELLEPVAHNSGQASPYKGYVYGEPLQPARQTNTQERYYQTLVRHLWPAVLVVNEARELVQSFGDVSQFLHVPEGKMTLDVLSMMPRELSLAASSGIHRTRKEGLPVTYKGIRMNAAGTPRFVSLRVDLLGEILVEGQPALFLLALRDDDPPLNLVEESAVTHSDELLNQRMEGLEQELQLTRENLQASIEELQTSNEELQATNEEMLAANEELQSTNEELQSVNEELNTVNSEYQAKNLELTALNNDMNNLMESTGIGTIFLDKQLCIRRFTSAITSTLNLLVQDIGRPFTDLGGSKFGEAIPDIRAVLENGSPLERPFVDGDIHYLMRILPFHNEYREVDGVVLTLVNITSQQRSMDSLVRRGQVLERILMASPTAQLMVDQSGIIGFANGRALELLQTDHHSLLLRSIYDLDICSADASRLSAQSGLLESLRLAQGQLDDLYLQIPCSGDRKRYRLTANPLYDADNAFAGALFTLTGDDSEPGTDNG